MKNRGKPLRRFLRVGLVVFLVFSMAGCGAFTIVRIPVPIPTFGIGGHKTAKKPSEEYRGPMEQVGLASWYGKDFHGRKTASGESFNMYGMTAAHPSLPFDTRVKVTNLENRRSVTLRINDRGPNVRGRIIDVSLAAARELEFEQQGLAQVKVEVR
ncbi:MAG TPA: septal ring lytic transglycosylase RlpA family protein [bacterium]|nr:septal ring lytic transglycosylase RlpA family protein [bacterium]